MTGESSPARTATRSEVLQILRGEFKKAVEALPPEILVMTVDEIEAHRKPVPTDYYLRKNLWAQIEIAQKTPDYEIPASNVYGNVMARQGFDRVLASPYRLAWLLIPPTQDLDKMRAQLSFGLDRLGNELLTMPINGDTAGHFIRLIEILLNRVHGPVVQRIEAKHAHLNLNKPLAVAQSVNQLEELRKKALEQRDVTPRPPADSE